MDSTTHSTLKITYLSVFQKLILKLLCIKKKILKNDFKTYSRMTLKICFQVHLCRYTNIKNWVNCRVLTFPNENWSSKAWIVSTVVTTKCYWMTLFDIHVLILITNNIKIEQITSHLKSFVWGHRSLKLPENVDKVYVVDDSNSFSTKKSLILIFLWGKYDHTYYKNLQSKLQAEFASSGKYYKP